MKVGIKQELVVINKVEFGIYLADKEGAEEKVLLPRKQVPEGIKPGDKITVFLYKDSRDRLIATVNEPKMTLGEVAKCRVIETGKIGAFLDWGLEKDLLLPFKEMTAHVEAEDEILVALYTDKSGRLCATMKLYHYLGTGYECQKGDWVEGTVYEISDNFGAFVAIEDKYQGLIPKKEVGKNIKVGQHVRARVTAVKSDGKIDLSMNEVSHIQMSIDADRVMKRLQTEGGKLPFNDKASPEIIREEMDMSKNEFKKAVGNLLKAGKIEIKPDSIVLK
ncbi:MAG: S1 RNA-binding domain-containing protein [Lachnospiraceae bacterium]|nr:S1 RNA-binding domain-containing protein [Candidatus Colinaster scatohippi]